MTQPTRQEWKDARTVALGNDSLEKHLPQLSKRSKLFLPK